MTSWEHVRTFFLRRHWLREKYVGVFWEDLYARKWGSLPSALEERLVWFITGYGVAQGRRDLLGEK